MLRVAAPGATASARIKRAANKSRSELEPGTLSRAWTAYSDISLPTPSPRCIVTGRFDLAELGDPPLHLTERLTVKHGSVTFNYMVERNAYDLDRIFQALADPTRRSILRGVARRERTIGEIAEPYRMSLAAVSKHLKVLERAKLIQRRKRGSFYHVRLNPQALKPAEEWIAFYKQFWGSRLAALKALVEETET